MRGVSQKNLDLSKLFSTLDPHLLLGSMYFMLKRLDEQDFFCDTLFGSFVF